MAVWPEVSLAIVAEYSSAISITVIIACFLSMIIFILRLNIHGKVEMKPGEAIPGQMMRGVYNPFSVEINGKRRSTFKDGVHLELKCHAPCVLQALWGVSIADLYPAIYLPWHHFVEQVSDDSWLEQHTLYRDEKLRLDICEKRRVNFQLPEDVHLNLGDLPRTKYPLVIVLLNEEHASEMQNTCVMGVVAVLHLQDDQCPGPSHIITQYIRTPVGQPYQLQQLYMASSDEDVLRENTNISGSAESAGPSSEGAETSQDISGQCVVCQTESINRVLLPCRHTCVCDSCFVHLMKCPMCRSPIESYFQLQPTEDSTWSTEETGQPDEDAPWWERWNNRLNTFFGFT